MANKYVVSIPIAGTIEFKVEAESPEEAKILAWVAYENGTQTPAPNWDAHEEMMTGNVQNFDQNDTEVDLVPD